MNAFYEHHQDNIAFGYRWFDRLLVNGLIQPFQQPERVIGGSWLNLIETLLEKMACTFLKHIRVGSLQELKDRILLGVAEINQEPVVHRWNKFEALKTYHLMNRYTNSRPPFASPQQAVAVAPAPALPL